MIAPNDRGTRVDLDLPPLYRLVTLRELHDAHAYGVRHAGELGGGTLVWVRRFDVAEFAVVLEPDEPLKPMRSVFFAGMNALGDALAVMAPPETPVAFAWPDAVKVDGAVVGGGRLAWPAGVAEDEPPPWLVFSAMISVRAMHRGDPGRRPDVTTLEEEGFEEPEAGRLIGAFARAFMAALDSWQEEGPGKEGRRYLALLEKREGGDPQLSPEGDLLVGQGDKGAPSRQSLAEALASPSWLDPETGLPWR
jgi:hypothetical protein